MQFTAVRTTWARWLVLPILLFLIALLAFDRVRLFQEFFTKYIDEDQAIEWYAAHEILHGQLHEPCFYGQSYNSNLEGILAAPLVALHLPYEIAVPLATVTLSLLPFLCISFIAWRRRQFLVATLALVVPALLSTRYDIITGMPRGFVTGVALGIVPAMLLLPPARKKVKAPPPAEEPALVDDPLAVPPPPTKPLRLRRSWPKTRYFFASLLTIVAVMLNPNAAVLLVPVALFGILTSFLEWRFWLFSFLGALAALPYPFIVYKWYFIWHPDYRLYLADRTFTWSRDNFFKFLPTLDEAFHDLVPQPLYDLADNLLRPLHHAPAHTFAAWAGHSPAPVVLLALFALLLLFLIARLRVAGTLALLAGVALVLISFCYSRVHDGRTAASFPYSRMFLAVPVLWTWLLLLINPPTRRPSPQATRAPVLASAPEPLDKPGRRFLRRSILLFRNYLFPLATVALILILTYTAWRATLAKNHILVAEAKKAYDTGTTARPVPLADGQRLARAVQAAADQYHVPFVLVLGGEARKWVYLLPELTTCETLYPPYERRTWRLYEECQPRYDKILVLNGRPRPRNKQIPAPIEISRDPPLALYNLQGKSVMEFCDLMNIRARKFTRPPVTTRPTSTSDSASPGKVEKVPSVDRTRK